MKYNKATKETLHHVVTVLFYMIAYLKHYIMKNVTTATIETENNMSITSQ